MDAKPSLHTDDDQVATQGPGSPALATEGDAGHAGDKPVQSRSQGVIMPCSYWGRARMPMLISRKTHNVCGYSAILTLTLTSGPL